MSDYLNLLNLPEGTVPQEVLDLLGNAEILLTAAILCFVVAFFGFRMFKAFFPAVLAAMFVGIAYTYVPALLETLGVSVDFMDLTATAAVVLAIVGLVLARYAFKFSVFLFIGYTSYEAGVGIVKKLAETYPDIEFFATATGELVISIALGVVLAFLSIFLFKFILIALTALGGMALCATFVVDAILPTMPEWYIVIPAGAVVGILAIIFQFKNTSVYSRRYR